MSNDFRESIFQRIERLDSWLEAHEYRGYEPFDGLSSYLRPLTFGNWSCEQVLQQLILRCPFHIRPWVGVKPLQSSKGMAYLARGYLALAQVRESAGYQQKSVDCLRWLMEHPCPGYSGPCWGNQFDYASGAFQLPKETPTLVWTALGGHAFLDAYEQLGDHAYLETATGIRDFILGDLPRINMGSGLCLSYVPFKEVALYNASMLGAGFLARLAVHVPHEASSKVAARAMAYCCAEQLGNGAWYYGPTRRSRWIDNWHTGYNLDSLKWYAQSSGDRRFDAHLKRGLDFYISHFFEDDGCPKYYYNRRYVVDIQSASQSIETLVFFSDTHSLALPLARKVAQWVADHMQDPSGYFHYRLLRWKSVKIPMIHWGQSTMLLALARLYCRLEAESKACTS